MSTTRLEAGAAGHGAEPREELAIRFFCELVEQGERPLFSAATTALQAELEARIETDVRARVGEAATEDEDFAGWHTLGSTEHTGERLGVGAEHVVHVVREVDPAPQRRHALRSGSREVQRHPPTHRVTEPRRPRDSKSIEETDEIVDRPLDRVSGRIARRV